MPAAVSSLPTLPPATKLSPKRTQRPHVAATPILSTPIPSLSPEPLPQPTAFANANVFEYGQAPQNAYAGPNDAVQVFYARFAPTLVKSGITVTVQAITTTNVVKIAVGTQGYMIALSQIAPSKWEAAYTFNTLQFPPGQSTAQLTLTATRADGSAASIQIPISLLP